MVNASGLFTLGEIPLVTGASISSFGTPLGSGEVVLTSVAVDSRKVKPHGLFVALEGEQTDGHRYLADAALGGASAALVRRGKIQKESPLTLFEVEEPLLALHALASHYLARFTGLTRIAVTGSSGKTSTKELLGSVLSAAAPTAVSKGNLNSDIGLPLALFSITEADRYGVFELGINRKGEMDQLTSLYKPHAVLITNIGVAHSGPLGGPEGVFYEKGRVFSSMGRGGLGFIPESEGRFGKLIDTYPLVEMVSYGPVSTRGLESIEDLGAGGWALQLQGESVHLPLPGRHNLMNGCGVISLAMRLGTGIDAIRSGFASAAPVAGRCRMIEGTVSVLDDSYNANPDSLEKMVDHLSSLQARGGKILVLGSMKELGEYAEPFHRAVAGLLEARGFKAVLLYGEEMAWAAEELQRRGYGGTFFHFYDNKFHDLQRKLVELALPGDLVLLKGSRVLELERLIPALEAAHV